MTKQRRGRAGWERLIARYEQSELTQAEFAGRHGVSVSSLRHWLYRFRREGGGIESEAVGFVEVHASTALRTKSRVELELPCGIIVRLGDVGGAEIADVVGHLRDLVRC